MSTAEARAAGLLLNIALPLSTMLKTSSKHNRPITFVIKVLLAVSPNREVHSLAEWGRVLNSAYAS